MIIPIALTLVAVSVAAIASIIAAIKTWECNYMKEKNSAMLADYLLSEVENIKMIEDRKAVAEKFDAELAKTKDRLNTADKAYDLLVKELEELEAKFGVADGIAKHFNFQYTNLIAMPRRKRDALVKTLRANK